MIHHIPDYHHQTISWTTLHQHSFNASKVDYLTHNHQSKAGEMIGAKDKLFASLIGIVTFHISSTFHIQAFATTLMFVYVRQFVKKLCIECEFNWGQYSLKYH